MMIIRFFVFICCEYVHVCVCVWLDAIDSEWRKDERKCTRNAQRKQTNNRKKRRAKYRLLLVQILGIVYKEINIQIDRANERVPHTAHSNEIEMLPLSKWKRFDVKIIHFISTAMTPSSDNFHCKRMPCENKYHFHRCHFALYYSLIVLSFSAWCAYMLA